MIKVRVSASDEPKLPGNIKSSVGQPRTGSRGPLVYRRKLGTRHRFWFVKKSVDVVCHQLNSCWHPRPLSTNIPYSLSLARSRQSRIFLMWTLEQKVWVAWYPGIQARWNSKKPATHTSAYKTLLRHNHIILPRHNTLDHAPVNLCSACVTTNDCGNSVVFC